MVVDVFALTPGTCPWTGGVLRGAGPGTFFSAGTLALAVTSLLFSVVQVGFGSTSGVVCDLVVGALVWEDADAVLGVCTAALVAVWTRLAASR